MLNCHKKYPNLSNLSFLSKTFLWKSLWSSVPCDRRWGLNKSFHCFPKNLPNIFTKHCHTESIFTKHRHTKNIVIQKNIVILKTSSQNIVIQRSSSQNIIGDGENEFAIKDKLCLDKFQIFKLKKDTSKDYVESKWTFRWSSN